MQSRLSRTLITEAEKIPLISYCCEGYQNGPRSPQSLSKNCENVHFLSRSVSLIVVPVLKMVDFVDSEFVFH